MKSILQYWIRLYCEGQWDTCARFLTSQRGDPVPHTLLPNGQLLKEGSKQ